MSIDVEKLAADRVSEAEKKAKDNAASTPKHTVLSMSGLTSAVWTLGMFEMVSGESCQCIHRTKQKNPCDVAVRHAACTVTTMAQHADLSSDIRTRPIWSSTISEVDLITKNSQIDWQECNNWRGKRSWDVEQMVAFH